MLIENFKRTYQLLDSKEKRTYVLISILILYVFLQLKLGKLFSLIYSLMFSLLMYPSVGVPFVDHHATIFVLASFCFFILGIKVKDNRYFFLIPFFLYSDFFVSKLLQPTVFLLYLC